MKALFFIVLFVFIASCEKEYTCETTVSYPNEPVKVVNSKIKAKSRSTAEQQCKKHDGNYHSSVLK